MAKRFEQENYGEVNSLLRVVIAELPVRYNGIILRYPPAIWASAFRWRKGKMPKPLLDSMAQGLRWLDMHIQNGMRFWYFEKFTTDAKYLGKLAASVGVIDFRATGNSWSDRVNASRGKDTFEDLPDIARRHYDRECRWFEERYYPTGVVRDIGDLNVETVRS